MVFWSLLVLAVVAIALFMAYFSFAPRIGSNPAGDRSARIRALRNHNGRALQNVVPTNMDMPFGKMLGVLWQFVKGGAGREPMDVVPSVPFDRAAWEALPNDGFAFAWFGHSSLLLKVGPTTFLIDPVFGERASTFSFAGPKRFRYTEHMGVDQLPKVDVVLLSHDHYDHLCHETIVALVATGNAMKYIVPVGVGAHLERWGVASTAIVEKAWWESLQVGTVKLTLAPARHFSGRSLTNRFSTLWGSWAFEQDGQRVYFGADSGYSPTFKEVGERLGPFDIAFLECGAYNERWADIHMLPEETAQAAVDVKASVLMPIHWAKYSLAMHAWKEPVERVSAKAKELSLPVFTPRPGRIVRWPDQAASERWWDGVR